MECFYLFSIKPLPLKKNKNTAIKAAKIRVLEWSVVVANFYPILQTRFLSTFFSAISLTSQCTTIFHWKVFPSPQRRRYSDVKNGWNIKQHKRERKKNHKPDENTRRGAATFFAVDFPALAFAVPIRYEKELPINHIIRCVIPSRLYPRINEKIRHWIVRSTVKRTNFWR